MKAFSLGIVVLGSVLLVLLALFLVVAGQVLATKDVITSIDTDANVILHDAAWKPDGSYALVVGDKGTVLKYNGTGVLPLSSGNTSDLYGVAWKPDESYALIVGHDSAILKYDGTAFTAINNTFNDSYDVAWSPNGSFALISGLSGKVLKYDGTNLTELTETYGGLSVAYNRYSEAIIVGEDCGVVIGYNGTNITFHNATQDIGAAGYAQAVAWSPDGAYALIVGLNGFAAKYENNVFSEIQTNTSEDLRSIAWCPVGNCALITGSDGTLLKYDGVKFFKINEDVDKDLFNVAWKLGSNEAVIIGYCDKQLPNTSTIQKSIIMKFVLNGSADPYLLFSEISTPSTTIGINESASTSIDITNVDIYSNTGTLNAVFSLNANILDNKSISLSPGEKKTVEYTWYANFTPGDYVLKVTIINGTLPTIYSITKNITILASSDITASISLDHTSPLDVNESVNISVKIKNDNFGLTTTIVNASLYLDNTTTLLTSGDFLQIKPIESAYLNYTWTPASEGYYNISAKIKTQNVIVNETIKQVCVKTKSLVVTNNPPQITSIGDQTVVADTLFTLQVFAIDPDNDTLTYTINTTMLSINLTGYISGTPTTSGTYSIKVTVSDGKDSTNTTFALKVNPKEEKPKTTGFLPGFEVFCAIAVIGAVVVMYRKRK